MPIFEFRCTTCDKSFEELVRSSSLVEEVVCPACGSHEVRRMISLFASFGGGIGSTAFSAPASSCAPSGG